MYLHVESLAAGVAEHLRLGAEADASDPPLADDLETFINGGGPADLSDHFKFWAEALARIRLQELMQAHLLDLLGELFAWVATGTATPFN